MMRPDMWARDWQGIPWAPLGRDRAGADCWGLVRLVLAAEAGIDVDDWLVDPDRRGRVAATLRREAASTTWGHVVWSRDRNRPDQLRHARAYDVVLMTEAGGHLPQHVGVVCGAGALLHSEEASGSVVAALDRLPILGRILSIHRHLSLT